MSASSTDHAHNEIVRGEAHRRRHRSTSHHRQERRSAWREYSVTTALGAALGLDSEREHDRLYRATLRSLTEGLIIGRGRHGVVVALTKDPSEPYFSIAVKVVSKLFTPSRGKVPSFHRAVSHTLHVQNEVAALARLSSESTFVLPLYCAFQVGAMCIPDLAMTGADTEEILCLLSPRRMTSTSTLSWSVPAAL